METIKDTTYNPNKRLCKDRINKTEKKRIHNYLLNTEATATMITEATGIVQKNVTRHKRELEKVNKLWQTTEKLCKVTGHKAWYLTTSVDIRNKAYSKHNTDTL